MFSSPGGEGAGGAIHGRWWLFRPCKYPPALGAGIAIEKGGGAMGSELGIARKFRNSDFGEISINLFLKRFFDNLIRAKCGEKPYEHFAP